jgi:hypothetical protein
MTQYQYKVVPFIGQLKSGVFSSEGAEKVSEQLQKLINSHAVNGWEFYRIDQVNIHVQAGCLASLLGAKSGLVSFDQVTFRQELP